MIVDLRTYTYLPGKFRKFLQSYENVGFALTSKHLGKTLGVLRSESGVQNRTFQFFMYEDSDHRDRCRAGMLADPEWAAFVKLDSDALLQQMNTLLRPTTFSPIGGQDVPPPTMNVQGKLRLFELTTWTCKPDTADTALDLLSSGGCQLLARHTPDVIGYFVPDTGSDHQILRLAAYASGAERDRCKRDAAAAPETHEFQVQFRPLLEAIDHTLLVPLHYSPLR